MSLETEVGPVLSYTPYYVYQMLVAAGCTLLKLSKSFFAAHIDMEYTNSLFNRTIWAIRGVSVSNNDLPERLAEVLAQMWRLGNAPTPKPADNPEMDDSLMLKVRCRMSMSLLYDSVWRWREDARTKGRNIEGMFVNSFFRTHIDVATQPILRTPQTRIQMPTHPHLRRLVLFIRPRQPLECPPQIRALRLLPCYRQRAWVCNQTPGSGRYPADLWSPITRSSTP